MRIKEYDLFPHLFYEKYDNYNAIEVPFTDAISIDYEGVMGVPISFLNINIHLNNLKL